MIVVTLVVTVVHFSFLESSPRFANGIQGLPSTRSLHRSAFVKDLVAAKCKYFHLLSYIQEKYGSC